MNKIIVGDWVEVLKTLPDGLVHCCITSPPYWGQRNYGVDGQLGLEKTPEEHIEKLVVGFRELRRVLRDDGVLWLNYGDKYASDNYGSGGLTAKQMTNPGSYFQSNKLKHNLKQGNLIGLAWRLALALQADGWYLRSDIIWAKALSFCEKYSGSTMPESVNGWRWERHKVKVKAGKLKSGGLNSGRVYEQGRNLADLKKMGQLAQWKPCPGCPKCAPDGLILRKGSWRPTRAHEYLFQLTKTSSYFCDMEAVREDLSGYFNPETGTTEWGTRQKINKDTNQNQKHILCNPSGRNLRDVFCINPQAYPDSHYATFPEKLVEPCIKVGTSQKGCCPKCGAQWARIMQTNPEYEKYLRIGGAPELADSPDGLTARHRKGHPSKLPQKSTTLGWLPTCKCGIKETVPAVVLDPFCGTATVCAVAAKLGRNYIGIELNPDYVKNQAEYRVAEGETGISKEEQKAGQMALFKGI